MEHPLEGSAWRRGWNDTKAAWTSWKFYILNVVAAGAIGGFTSWYWGLFVIVVGMFFVWIGATISALIKQRNEAWSLLKKRKSVPLSNRNDLIRALTVVKKTANEYISQLQGMDRSPKEGVFTVNTTAIGALNKACENYKNAIAKLEEETLIAGKEFECFITYFRTFLLLQETYAGSPELDKNGFKAEGLELSKQLDAQLRAVISKIDEISLPSSG